MLDVLGDASVIGSDRQHDSRLVIGTAGHSVADAGRPFIAFDLTGRESRGHQRHSRPADPSWSALNRLPAAAYTGLRPGKTYYAYDPVTATYWAGAQLVPSSTSLAAQVSVQDDGAFDIFSRPTGQTWTAHPSGLGGVGGTVCIRIPASILAVWHWVPGSCRPPA